MDSTARGVVGTGHSAVEDVFPNCPVAVHVSNLWWHRGSLGSAEAGYTPDVAAVSQYSKYFQDIDGTLMRLRVT